MKTNDINVLLKKSLSQELLPPPELERLTWQKMNALPRKKMRIFTTLLSIIGFIILVAETIILLSFIPNIILKITFLHLYFSMICIIVFYLIVSINSINLKRIL